jgi:hypothetical protein
MNVKIILLWLQTTGLTLEWTSAEGRTFQCAGRRGMAGFWERLFHSGSHPTRRQMSDREAAEHFAAAESLVLYTPYKDEGETISREQLFGKIEELFPGAKGGAK